MAEEPYLALNEDELKRVSLSIFKGKVYVSIREHYITASGEIKPGIFFYFYFYFLFIYFLFYLFIYLLFIYILDKKIRNKRSEF